MVKIVQDKEARIKLQRGNKIIDRSLKDYQANKSVYDFRGFKPVQDVVKEIGPKLQALAHGVVQLELVALDSLRVEAASKEKGIEGGGPKSPSVEQL